MQVILNIPHTSINLGTERNNIALTDEELAEEIEIDTDWGADKLFLQNKCKHQLIPITAQISRIICDIERFKDWDELDNIGRGAIYTKSIRGHSIRKYLTKSEYERLINSYYIPYHKNLEYQVYKSLHEQQSALIIDCHTFCSKSITIDSQIGDSQVEVNIGVDSYHTPIWLWESLQSCLSKEYIIGINNPFSGSLVPISYYKLEPKLNSIMIEVNRDKVADERFKKLALSLTNWINTLGR